MHNAFKLLYKMISSLLLMDNTEPITLEQGTPLIGPRYRQRQRLLNRVFTGQYIDVVTMLSLNIILFAFIYACIKIRDHEQRPYSIWLILKGILTLISYVPYKPQSTGIVIYSLCNASLFIASICLCHITIDRYLSNKHVSYLPNLILIITMFDIVHTYYLCYKYNNINEPPQHISLRNPGNNNIRRAERSLRESYIREHTHEFPYEHNDDQYECVICIDTFKSNDTCLSLDSCDHFFHKDCIMPWLINGGTCPLCRGEHMSI